MPIYQGTSTKNKSEIVINGTQMGKVYVGDRLVWVKPSGIFYPEYGLLYNFYAATHANYISSSNDWIVPLNSDWETLYTYLGGMPVSGGKMKETGYLYWNSPNTGATNEVGFNSRGSGARFALGSFSSLNSTFYAWLNYLPFGSPYYFQNGSTTDDASNTSAGRQQGSAIRLVYTGVGTPTSYTGNDGKVYRAVLIDTQYWLADNLSETRFRNNDIIPWHGADPANYFTNAEWAALTTAGVCAYDNTLSNVATGFTFPT